MEYRQHLNPYKTSTLSKAVETATDFTRNSSAFGSSNFVCGEAIVQVGLDTGKTSTEATEFRLEGPPRTAFEYV